MELCLTGSISPVRVLLALVERIIVETRLGTVLVIALLVLGLVVLGALVIVLIVAAIRLIVIRAAGVGRIEGLLGLELGLVVLVMVAFALGAAAVRLVRRPAVHVLLVPSSVLGVALLVVRDSVQELHPLLFQLHVGVGLHDSAA